MFHALYLGPIYKIKDLHHIDSNILTGLILIAPVSPLYSYLSVNCCVVVMCSHLKEKKKANIL